MSEGVSEILRSNKPSSLKRSRAEDLDSGGSTGQSGCLYKVCRKSGSEENGTRGTHRSFCGKTHRDFFMAELFDVIRNGGAQVTQEPSGKCNLSGCDLPVREPYDFCNIKHADKHIEDMTKQWDLDGRLCQFELCLHHVHVGEQTQKISNYCCLEHKFSAARARGRQSAAVQRTVIAAARPHGAKDPVCGDENPQISISQEGPRHLLQGKIETQSGYHEEVSRDAIMNCLKHHLTNPGDLGNADPNGYFCTDKSILDFHPFDEVIGFVPKWYLHWIDSKPLIDSKPGRSRRRRKTKQGFGWKQSSRDHENKSTCQNLNTNYFHYELRGKVDSNDSHCDKYVEAYLQDKEARKTGKLKRRTETRWKLSQFSLVDNLVNGKLPSKIPVISKIHQDKKGEPVWPPLPQEKETVASVGILSNKNTVVLVGSTSEASCHVDERGMTNSVSTNTPPPVEGLPTGQEILQNPYSNGLEESDGFLQDAPVLRRAMEVFADESNAPSAVGTIPEVRFQKDRGMISSSPPSPSPGDGLPMMNADYSFLDDFFDQSKVGGDNVFSWILDGNPW